MKRIIHRINWIWWLLTGYQELSGLIREMNNPYNALTPVGEKRLEELALKEGELRRKVKGIQK